MAIPELLILLVTIATLFIWNRSESRSDARHMDAKIDVIRELAHTIHKETQASINAIREEIRDFHSKIYDIQGKNKDP